VRQQDDHDNETYHVTQEKENSEVVRVSQPLDALVDVFGMQAVILETTQTLDVRDSDKNEKGSHLKYTTPVVRPTW
jgi:hypothetical protein